MSKLPMDDSLHSACYNQDVELVQKLLIKIKPSMLNKKLTNYSSPIQGTPLHISCKNGCLDIVKLLIEAGADKEIKDVARQSPLSIAAAKNHYAIVEYLISVGANVHSKGPNNLLPIHFACAHGSREIIELILSKGVEINLVDSQKSSLLDFTTNLEGGNLEAAKTLVEKGIDRKYFSTAFRWACWRNNLQIAEYLLENGADYKSETGPKSELLYWICSLGYADIVRLLLDLGVDFKKHAKFKGKMLSYDGSPLDKAIETKHFEIIKLINEKN